MPSKVFDSKSHALYVTTHDGITFALEGEPDGNFFSAVFDNDAISTTAGSKGDVQASQSVQSAGTLTYTGQWGSASNNTLNQVMKDQQAGNYMTKIELKRINANENVTVVTCSRAWIGKTADLSGGSEAANRAWPFKLEFMEFPETQAPA